jgi:hypothetical protein
MLLATVTGALPRESKDLKCEGHEDADHEAHDDSDTDSEDSDTDSEDEVMSEGVDEEKAESLPKSELEDEIVDTSDEPGVVRVGRPRTSRSRRNKLRRKRRRKRKADGPLANGAPITSQSESARKQRERRQGKKFSDRFFETFGKDADAALEALSRSNSARKKSKQAEKMQALQKIGENVTEALKRPKGKKAPHQTGLAAIAMQGVPVASRVAVGLSPEQAKEAGRLTLAYEFRGHLDEHVRAKFSKKKVGDLEQAATVNDFKRPCPVPSGAEDAGVHQMTRTRAEQYLSYRTNYPALLVEMYNQLGEAEDLDLSTKFGREVMAAHLGCTNVEGWAAKTAAEKKREVLCTPSVMQLLPQARRRAIWPHESFAEVEPIIVDCQGEPGRALEREQQARQAFESPPPPDIESLLESSSDDEDDLPSAPPPPLLAAAHGIDPKTFVLRPRSWLTYWAMIDRANLRIRIVKTPYSCEVHLCPP